MQAWGRGWRVTEGSSSGAIGRLCFFIWIMNMDKFSRGKGSIKLVFPCQIAAVNLFQNRTGPLSALFKGQNICVINKTNTSSREIRGVASVNEISIVE